MEASELNKTLERHQLWIETNGVQGKLAVLTGANLCYAKLTGADLKGADLINADLYSANLRGANIQGADLLGANLLGADLRDADLSDADLWDANLEGANLEGANLNGANLNGANLSNAILPDISWIIPGCLVQLNHVMDGFYLEKERKWDNFIQDSFGFFIKDNMEEKTFDILVEDKIIQGIPHWVKYSGLKQLSENV